MKTIDNDLENLFREIRLETPSPGFTEKLSFRIEKEIQKKEKKRKWTTAGQIAAGVLGMIASVFGTLYWQSEFTFSFLKPDISFDPLVWIIGLTILLLLIGDSLFRKYIHS